MIRVTNPTRESLLTRRMLTTARISFTSSDRSFPLLLPVESIFPMRSAMSRSLSSTRPTALEGVKFAIR